MVGVVQTQSRHTDACSFIGHRESRTDIEGIWFHSVDKVVEGGGLSEGRKFVEGKKVLKLELGFWIKHYCMSVHMCV